MALRHLHPRRRHTDEYGAVAVLYSILMALMLALVALVIDLGALRVDRRATQSTADLAVTSGALELLSEFGGSPAQACKRALQYFVENTGPVVGSIPPTACAGYPTTDDACYADPAYTLAPQEVEFTGSPYVVILTWPVDYGDILPQDGYDAELDGHRCERFGMQVARTRGFVFGAVFGSITGATGAPAVARAVVGETGKDVASLVLLDKHGCNALRTVGDTTVRVIAALDDEGEWKEGKIYVDSDAADCSPGYTINSGGQGTIVAEGDDASPPAPGQIRLLALPAGAATCTGNACNPSDIMEPYDLTKPGIWPQPINLPERTNRTPADHRYNCKASYAGLDGEAPYNLAWNVPACSDATATSDYIDQLESKIGSGSSNPSPWDALTNMDGFLDWSTLAVPGGCSPKVDVVVPPGNWYVDCPNPTGFQVTKNITFEGGNIVFRGKVSIGAGGNLTVNDNNLVASLPASCLTEVCIKSSSAKAAYVYIGRGDLEQGSDTARFTLDNGLVYLRDGVTKVTKGSFDWVAPNEGPFEDLALWDDHEPTSPAASPKPTEHALVGGGSTSMEGVYFTPNSVTKISGGGGSTPKEAQFFTWDLEVSGGGTILVKPNPERALPVLTFLGVRLIR